MKGTMEHFTNTSTMIYLILRSRHPYYASYILLAEPSNFISKLF